MIGVILSQVECEEIASLLERETSRLSFEVEKEQNKPILRRLKYEKMIFIENIKKKVGLY
ncbi:hypothetical protein LC087_14695 [Bacillus carboniphilus]|uniref:Uncharacterized protein n=1 Tax=Bacillus carboniphilus TaxID=86663 RepID=A0ABY9JRJ8_9BACI|nr:hypothetical protein [Bacillus carboniphilus]WLR42025.1 hypothetical protein LC087_14695 [Bacillus carboniphilus]